MAARSQSERKSEMTGEPKRTRSKRKVGRPKRNFDLDLVRELGRIHSTHEEAALLLECPRSTFEAHLADMGSPVSLAWYAGLAEGKRLLRSGMMALCAQGNVTALMYYHKHHLAFPDTIHVESTVAHQVEVKEEIRERVRERAKKLAMRGRAETVH